MDLPTTYTKWLINEWKIFREILDKITLTLRKKNERISNDERTLLSDEQCYEMFYGPFHSFTLPQIAAYTLIYQCRALLNLKSEAMATSIKENASIETNMGLSLTSAQIEQLNAALLDKKEQSLQQMTQAHFNEILNFVKDSFQQIILALLQNNIEANENEKQLLGSEENWQELTNRAGDLKVSIPKKKEDRTLFLDYFTLKTKLAIHSILSRQHEPHDENILERKLKLLKKTWQDINKKEELLFDRQKKELNQLMQDLPTWGK